MKLEKLTKQQEDFIPVLRYQWLNYILSCKNSLDRERASKGIEWLYKFCEKEKPIMIFMDSPLGCQVAANFFKSKGANIVDNIRDNIGDNIRGNIWDNIWDNIGDNIWDNIGANIVDNIGANIGGNIWDNIRGNIWDNIWDNIWANIVDNIGANIVDNIGDNIGANIGANIGDNIRDNIWDNIRDNIWDNIRDNIWDNMTFETTSYYGNCGDYGWVAFLDYFIQLDLIKTDNKEDFNSFKELLLSGVYDMIQYDGMCIVSDMPTKIKQDQTTRLHNVNGFAVEWKDGFGMNFIHGVFISPSTFEKLIKKEYLFEDWVKESNEEVKSAILSFMEEKWGSEFLFRFISDNLKEVDTYVDKKDEKYLKGTTGGMNIGVYTLFKGSVNNIPLAFVRCYCPSTDRMFFLCVDSSNNNAADAIASLYRVPSKLKSEIKYIQRQGERFSTVFTDKGKKLLESLSKEDVSNLTHITGKQYFSQLKYEY